MLELSNIQKNFFWIGHYVLNECQCAIRVGHETHRLRGVFELAVLWTACCSSYS